MHPKWLKELGEGRHGWGNEILSYNLYRDGFFKALCKYCSESQKLN